MKVRIERFQVVVDLRQRYVMSPWLCNMHMDGVVREVKARVMEIGAALENKWRGSKSWR